MSRAVCCLFRRADLAASVAPTLMVACAVGALVHILGAARLLPEPSPELDPDRTVLGVQSGACRRPSGANIVLTGDSSCLTSVDARELGRLLPGNPKVINLSLFSGIALRVYGEIALEYVRANPDRVSAVLLLVTPGKLQDTTDTSHLDGIWSDLHARRILAPTDPPPNLARRSLALPEFEQTILPHLLVPPLRGEMGGLFGFTAGLRDAMHARHGSGLHPGRFRPPPHRVNFDLPLAPGIIRESRALRARWPAAVRLIAAIMPLPESLPEPGYSGIHQRLAEEWREHLQPDVFLRLPATLPDSLYANDSHMNEIGQPCFTRIVARAMASGLESTGDEPSPGAVTGIHVTAGGHSR